VDGGLIPRKPGGSLAKEAAEALSSILDRWIKIGRLRLDPSRERVSADLDARIKIGRLKGDLGLHSRGPQDLKRVAEICT
jgi:hypothetical protein